MVRSLLDAGLPLQRIRRAVEYLQTDEAVEDWANLRLVSDGTTVFACRDDGQVLDALAHGQLALFVSLDGIVREVEAEVRQFSSERDQFVDALRTGVAEPPSEAAGDSPGQAGVSPR